MEIWGPGNLGIWRYGDLQIQKCGVQKLKKKIKILKIRIRSAQNVEKVWVSRKNPPGPIWGPSKVIFSMDRKKIQTIIKKCLFSLVGQWALFTRVGPLLLSTRGGAIGYLIPFWCADARWPCSLRHLAYTSSCAQTREMQLKRLCPITRCATMINPSVWNPTKSSQLDPNQF